MARKNKSEVEAKFAAIPVVEVAEVVEFSADTMAALPEAMVAEALPVLTGPVEVHAEVAADNARRNSVVKPAYKHRYAERAANSGLKRKAAQRSAWDWLAQTLAGECLVEGDRLSIERFVAILEANGVDHSRWTNRSKGWEGRFRMTGRLALQKVVAEAMELKLPDGEVLVPPAEWVAKYAN
jgi:hypothetical protein